MVSLAQKILAAPLGKTHLFSLGQAGFVLKNAQGGLLAVDPYLSECVERVEGHVGFKRLLPHLLDPFDLNLDAVIATHPHYDHFDMDAIPQVMSNGRTRLFASVECQKEVARLKMSDEGCQYVCPGDQGVCAGFHLFFTTCDHGAGAPDAVGVIIETDGKRVFIAGDTCLRLDRQAEYLARGPIDLLIAPINGAYGNLNEEECAALSEALAARLTIPCHYGMFASHGGNPGKFKEIMDAQHPGRAYLLMRMGEQTTL